LSNKKHPFTLTSLAPNSDLFERRLDDDELPVEIYDSARVHGHNAFRFNFKRVPASADQSTDLVLLPNQSVGSILMFYVLQLLMVTRAAPMTNFSHSHNAFVF
jgi:hypothetical protein